MKKKIGRVKMYYFFYKNWQKFIHRFNYHHMKPNITKEYAWCHWCGLRDKIVNLDEIKDQILPPKETKRMNKTPDSFREAVAQFIDEYELGVKTWEQTLDAICELHEREIGMRVGFLRQWLNEDRITDKKLVTNEEIKQMLGLNRKE